MSQARPNGPNYGILISRFSGSSQWDRTLETAQEWLAVEPENSEAHFAAGQALINLDRHAEAQPHIEKVLARQPQNAAAHRFLSLIHFRGKRFREADEAIQKAVSLAPQDYFNWYWIAFMFYQNRDYASARKYAEKARQLNPRSPAVANLLALCTPATPIQRLHQYLKALELNPESPEVHNNIGAHYLAERDYKTAEQCFRRALHFNPRLKMAQKNLFDAMKHRDKVYRALCLPKDMLSQWLRLMRKSRQMDVRTLSYPAVLFISMLAWRYAMALILLWFLLLWPMVKVYEFLTVGDVRANAGEVGARRGGFLNYRRWSLKLRLAIFGLCLISFWSLVGWWVYSSWNAPTGNAQRIGAIVLGVGALAVVLVLLVNRIRKSIKAKIASRRARSRARRLSAELNKANIR